MIPDAVFTLEAAKAHLRVLHDSEDALITAMLDAAVAECERITRRAWTHREWSVALNACDVDCRCDSWAFHAELSPAIAVVFRNDPVTGVPDMLPASDVRTYQQFGHTVVRVTNWPASPQDQLDVGSIKFVAEPADGVVPADVYAAAMLFLGDLYENRESSVVGIAMQQNPTAERLLRSYVIEMHV